MVKTKKIHDINPQMVEVGGKKLVIMDEEDYDRLLDAIDLVEAERTARDPEDPVLTWEEIKEEFVKNRIADMREQAGITQQELARRLKVRQSTVSRMERENANLTLSTLRKIAKALNCPVHQLIS
jgi:DNA-binding XRE family transcriptional regulator